MIDILTLFSGIPMPPIQALSSVFGEKYKNYLENEKALNELQNQANLLSKYDFYNLFLTYNLIIDDKNFKENIKRKIEELEKYKKTSSFVLKYVDKKEIPKNKETIDFLISIAKKAKSFTDICDNIKKNKNTIKKNKHLIFLITLIVENKKILKDKINPNLVSLLIESDIELNNFFENKTNKNTRDLLKNRINDLYNELIENSKIKVGYIKVKNIEKILNNTKINDKKLFELVDGIKYVFSFESETKKNIINQLSQQSFEQTLFLHKGLFEEYIKLVHIYQYYWSVYNLNKEVVNIDNLNIIKQLTNLIKDNIIKEKNIGLLNTIKYLDIKNFNLTKGSIAVIVDTINNYIGPLISKLTFIETKELLLDLPYKIKIYNSNLDLTGISNKAITIQDSISLFLNKDYLVKISNED